MAPGVHPTHCKRGHLFDEKNTYWHDGKRHCRACRLAVTNNRSRAARRNQNLKSRYGLGFGQQQFDDLMERQQWACALCGCSLREKSPFQIHVDHCYATGAIRGILCTQCNTGLGRFGDDPGRLRAAIAYLERPPAFVPPVPSRRAFGRSRRR